MKYYIIVYKNTHDAMEAESRLSDGQYLFRVMPTPTSITQSCGMCTRIEDDKQIEDIINNKIVNYKNIYLKDSEGFKLIK